MRRERWLTERTSYAADGTPASVGAAFAAGDRRATVFLRCDADDHGRSLAWADAARRELQVTGSLVERVVVVAGRTGEALQAALSVDQCVFAVWFTPDFGPVGMPDVAGLLEPLVGDARVAYVVGAHAHSGGHTSVDEVCTRPLMNLFYPQLAGVLRPTGAVAARRDVVLRAGSFDGPAVEVGLLIDMFAHGGLAALAQVVFLRPAPNGGSPVFRRTAHEITATVAARVRERRGERLAMVEAGRQAPCEAVGG